MCLFQILLILVFSYFIGEERSNCGKDIGFRSVALIMLGAYTFTLSAIAESKVIDYHVIAQIVTGISFVGAGLIIKDNGVKNLTTAITVWTSAALAVLIGIENYKQSIIIFFTVFCILRSKHLLE